ncbi:hypothetical protein LXL04_026627 [Taraxacum kok-saghyz]
MERVSTLREEFSISFSIRPQHIKPYLPPSLRLLRNTSNDHPSSANRQPPPLSLIADDMPERERELSRTQRGKRTARKRYDREGKWQTRRKLHSGGSSPSPATVDLRRGASRQCNTHLAMAVAAAGCHHGPTATTKPTF